MSAPNAGGYRDEREAALAQVQALQQKLSELEPEVLHLRAENAQLRGELARYSGFAPSPAPAKSNPILLAMVAVVAMLVLMGGAGFFLFVATSRAESVPSVSPVSPVSVPVSAPMPSSAPPVMQLPSIPPSAAAAS